MRGPGSSEAEARNTLALAFYTRQRSAPSTRSRSRTSCDGSLSIPGLLKKHVDFVDDNFADPSVALLFLVPFPRLSPTVITRPARPMAAFYGARPGHAQLNCVASGQGPPWGGVRNTSLRSTSSTGTPNHVRS